MTVQRGEIYWVDFEPVKGSELGGIRPALVVQQDLGNTYSPTTVVAAITRAIPRKAYPFTVVIAPNESGLREPSLVNCSQLFTIQQKGPSSRLMPGKGQTVTRPIGKLGTEKLREVDDALKYNLGLP